MGILDRIIAALIYVPVVLSLVIHVEGAEEGDSCVLSTLPGTCMVLQECEPIWNLVVKAGRPMPSSVRALLDAARCGFRGIDPVVCCVSSSKGTSTTELFNRRPTTARPTATLSSSRDPPDVRNHRNLRLLPTDCGMLEDDRIFGGNATGPFEYPWMVLVGYNHRIRGRLTSCGATLINERYVLTAAHCVTKLSALLTLADVVVGEHDVRTNPDCEIIEDTSICKDPIKTIKIADVISHPGYDPSRLHDDVALIRLSERVDLSGDSVKAICLPTTRELQTVDLTPLKMLVAGWGATEDGMASPVLLKVELPVVTMEKCQEIYNGSARIDSRQVCAGGEPDKDSCGGDSGGPLMYPGRTARGVRLVQHGIVSFGHRSCGIGGYPGVYTRVAHYIDWILDNIRD